MSFHILYTDEKFKTFLKFNSERLEWTGDSVKTLNSAISFDIETSSFYNNKQKCATMYVWAFDIFDMTFVGRTWSEFVSLLTLLSKHFKLTPKRLIRVYVHNLSYEFQFLHTHLKWRKVFASKARTVIYAISTLNIEFRCSYLLYGSKLSTLSEEMLFDSDLEKISTYDYKLIRHSETPLTDFEISYVVRDVKIVSAYINKCIHSERSESISTIPLTKTGYVRRLCRERCLAQPSYKYMIHGMNLTYAEYITAKAAFAGGFTHSNPKHTDCIRYNVDSYDFSSSYPAVMLSEKYPMSSGILVTHATESEFLDLMHNYLCICTLTLRNVVSVFDNDFYISLSKCEYAKEPYDYRRTNHSLVYDPLPLIVSNGRIVQADELKITITSIDFRVIEKLYNFQIVNVANLYYYHAHYLPKQIIETILDLYQNKTELKGVEGQEELYMMSKAMLNSIYGMTVTDILRNEYLYDSERSEWLPPNIVSHQDQTLKENKIERENTKSSRFLFYLWGCFVTAYARANLWSGIVECGSDYIYSDTDSIKILNSHRHQDYIQSYNSTIVSKIDTCLTYYNIDPERSRPKGKQMGIWDFDGHYNVFKTLGAKRYIYLDKSDELHITIAGLSKSAGRDYILQLAREKCLSLHLPFAPYHSSYSDSIMSVFTNTLYIPAGHTGKMTHTYIDTPINLPVTDYLGNTYTISEPSSIHLEDVEYSLSLSQDFLDFLHHFMLTQT